jgi:hypothetical protein
MEDTPDEIRGNVPRLWFMTAVTDANMTSYQTQSYHVLISHLVS